MTQRISTTAMMAVISMAAILALPTQGEAKKVAKINAQPGEWEMSVVVNMPGLPIPTAPILTKQCITEKELVPDGPHKDQNCKVSEQKITKNKISWKMDCTDPGSGTVTKGTGEVAYSKTTLTGKMDMEMQMGAQKMTMGYILRESA